MTNHNRVRRITISNGGTRFCGAVPDGAKAATGPITENEEVSCFTDASNVGYSHGSAEEASGGSSPFSPEDITELSAWWDPTLASTIDNPSSITAFRDRVAGASFDQTNPGARPSTATVSGDTMINYDGGDQLFDLVGHTELQPGSDDFTVVAVFRSTSAGRGMIMIKDNGAGRRWLLRTHLNGTDMEFSVDDDTVAQTVTASDVDFSDNTVRVVFGVRDGTNLRFYYGDGGTLTEDAASPVAIGSYGALGAGQASMGDVSLGGGQALTGDVGDIMFFKKALTSEERANVYSFLVSKWSL